MHGCMHAHCNTMQLIVSTIIIIIIVVVVLDNGTILYYTCSKHLQLLLDSLVVISISLLYTEVRCLFLFLFLLVASKIRIIQYPYCVFCSNTQPNPSFRRTDPNRLIRSASSESVSQSIGPSRRSADPIDTIYLYYWMVHGMKKSFKE